MSILVTFDRQEIYVTEEQADKIWEAKEAGAPVTIRSVHTGKVKWRGAAGAIAYIKTGGSDPDQPKLPPPPTPEITPEKRAQNLKKLAEIKANYLNRRAQKASTP